MEQLIEKLISMGMEQFIGESRQELAMSDQVYLKDIEDTAALEIRYESLGLATGQKMVFDDYIACMKSAEERYGEISYMAGIRDTVKMLLNLGLIQNV